MATTNTKYQIRFRSILAPETLDVGKKLEGKHLAPRALDLPQNTGLLLFLQLTAQLRAAAAAATAAKVAPEAAPGVGRGDGDDTI